MDLTAIIVVPVVFYFTFKFLEALIRRKERMVLVEKLDVSNLQTMPSLDLSNVLDSRPNKRFAGLRMGLLLTGIGLGLIVAWAVSTTLSIAFIENDLKMDWWRYRDMFQTIFLAAPAFFGGIGLLVSYVIEQRALKSAK
jgi:hypothetical protein